MKVSEIKYERCNIDEVKSQLTSILADIRAAKSAEELLDLREKMIAINKKVQTMISLSYIRYTLDTADDYYVKEKSYYDENTPALSALGVKISRAFLENPHFSKALDKMNPNVAKIYELAIKTMDEKIVPDLVQENRSVMEYNQLINGLTFRFKNSSMPLSVLRKYFDDADRSVRKSSMEVAGKKLATVSDKLDKIYDDLVKIRTVIAKKMGYKSYAELGDLFMSRYSYNRGDIAQFRRGIVDYVVPLVAKKRLDVAATLGIKDMKLYDNEVCFAEGNPEPVLSAEEMFVAAKEMYHDMHPLAGEFIDYMLSCDAFDVFPKKGKWGGGYCTSLDEYKLPFILANFNGSGGDVDVLTHEAGHALAFYNMLTRNTDYELNLGTMSVAEIHSMSMEFLAYKYMDKFFGKRAKDYKFSHLLSSLTFLPYGCAVDEFEQTCYDNPDLTPSERNGVWLKGESVYRPYLSAEGIPYFEKGTRWQYQMHIFENPMYYIDYCLAQSVAHQFLTLSVKDYKAAFDKYMQLLGYAGEKSFQELLSAVGLANPLEKDGLKGIIPNVMAILEGFERK